MPRTTATARRSNVAGSVRNKRLSDDFYGSRIGNGYMPDDGGTAYFNANYGRLSERVENQGKDIADLRSNMNTGFLNLGSQIARLSDELRSGGKTQWPIFFASVSIGITILGGLGFLSLQPVKDDVAQLQSVLVTRQEMDYRSLRGNEDRMRTEQAIRDIRDGTVTRNEWSERNHARDNELSDIQRQLDQIRTDYVALSSSLGNGGDNIRGLQQELSDLRRQLIDLLSRQRAGM